VTALHLAALALPFLFPRRAAALMERPAGPRRMALWCAAESVAFALWWHG